MLFLLVAEVGYDFEDVMVMAAGCCSLVWVIVDADGGIDFDVIV